MNDNEEYKTLKSSKKNVYRTQKRNLYNINIIIILIIVCSFQFIIIIYLLFFSNKNNINKEEINDINIDNNNININNKKESEKEEIKEGKLEYKKEENKNNKKGIHIAMALDNSAIYSTLVSMTSALENNNKDKNILIYHLLLSNDFDMNKLSYFESLKKDYEFILNYIKIPQIFKYITKKWKRTETMQYKLL